MASPRRRKMGTIERRLAVAIALAAVLPLVASLLFARAFETRAIAIFYNPEYSVEIERSLGVYNDLAKAMKDALRAKGDAIAAQEPLRAAAILKHQPSVEQELDKAFAAYPDLVSATIESVDAGEDEEAEREVVARKDRGRPVDDATERKLDVDRALWTASDGRSRRTMKLVFAAPRERLDYQQHAAEFLQAYRALEKDRLFADRVLLFGYGFVIFVTIPISVVIGIVLARKVTRRIAALSSAAIAVGQGDLSARVREGGDDEMGDLERAFNRMVSEVEESRARIDFLRRMSTWQEMARRLAHEIKNPLTPIQLAVQEIHERYEGDDAGFRKLLDTTREIVEEEVGTLRRLVGEFSSFARLPRADLARGDLKEFLEDQRTRFAALEPASGEDEVPAVVASVCVKWRLGEDPMPVALDRQMLHRVLANVLGNAAQAIRSVKTEGGQIVVTASAERGGYVVDVDDDGPGVPEGDRARIFDPYFTTKKEGTGLGLAIVKKIVVEHGGTIEALASSLGGTKMRIWLPRIGTPASDAALALGEPNPPSSRRSVAA